MSAMVLPPYPSALPSLDGLGSGEVGVNNGVGNRSGNWLRGVYVPDIPQRSTSKAARTGSTFWDEFCSPMGRSYGTDRSVF